MTRLAVGGLVRVAERATLPEIDAAAILGAVPVPVLLLDAQNRFRFVNHAAEQFMGLSRQQLSHMTLSELVPSDSQLFQLIELVRARGITIADHDLTIESPRLRKRSITVQATVLAEEPGCVLLSMQDYSRRPGRVRAVLRLDRPLAGRRSDDADMVAMAARLWALIRDDAAAAEREVADAVA